MHSSTAQRQAWPEALGFWRVGKGPDRLADGELTRQRRRLICLVAVVVEAVIVVVGVAIWGKGGRSGVALKRPEVRS